MKMINIAFSVLFFIGALLTFSHAHAQENLPEEPEFDFRAWQSNQIKPNDVGSVLFTYWEHTAIRDARRSRGMVRAPTEQELSRDLNFKTQDMPKPPAEERDISLGGIVFVDKGDWTIWLNGKRVTPKALPREVLDLQVHREYVELKWFDEWSNQIFPIRLRPHQRFNIDMRVFLPG